jgi:hypothetical protein
MFMEIPDRASGMNSVRIAEVLNYRLRLPPIVSLSHIHALGSSPTATEREIARLIHSGLVRKVSIPGRGTGSSAIGDGLVLVSAWERLVRADMGLEVELKEKYIALLKTRSAPSMSLDEIRKLSQAGYLTGSTVAPTASDTFLRPATASLGSLQSVAGAGSRHEAGSEGAVATSATAHISGGTGSSSRILPVSGPTSSHSFSLPNTGPYLRLLSTARDHIYSLLSKSGPHKSMPLERLKERWDGGVADTEVESHARKGILPGKTKKWRQFYGLEFEWILAECVGAGLVECFATGSIGIGVRVI